jgi:hypothetical protein
MFPRLYAAADAALFVLMLIILYSFTCLQLPRCLRVALFQVLDLTFRVYPQILVVC